MFSTPRSTSASRPIERAAKVEQALDQARAIRRPKWALRTRNLAPPSVGAPRNARIDAQALNAGNAGANVMLMPIEMIWRISFSRRGRAWHVGVSGSGAWAVAPECSMRRRIHLARACRRAWQPHLRGRVARGCMGGDKARARGWRWRAWQRGPSTYLIAAGHHTCSRGARRRRLRRWRCRPREPSLPWLARMAHAELEPFKVHHSRRVPNYEGRLALEEGRQRHRKYGKCPRGKNHAGFVSAISGGVFEAHWPLHLG